MRKLKLFKSLLVVAMLLVGGVSSVWADKTYMTTMTGLLGLTDNSTPAWTYYTKTVTLKAGETYTYTFQNYTKGSSATAEHETWIAEIRENTSGYCLDARGDGGGWTWDGDTSTGTLAYNYSGKSWNEGGRTLSDFMTAYNDVTVTLTISCSNNGKEVTIARAATLNGDTDFSGTWTCSNFAGHDKTINLIAEASHLNITKVVYTNASGVVTNYELKNIDLSNFDTYFSGSYSDGVATFTKEGNSKQWAKLPLSSYFSGITGTITNVNMKFTENMNDGGRMTIGIYGNDKTSWATNAWQDTGDAVSAWGLTGSSSATRIYHSSTYAQGVTLGSATEIEVDMDVVNKKFTWIQGGTTKVNNQNYCASAVSLPQYFALYSWSGDNTTTISDMTMEVVYVEASYYTATFTNTVSNKTVSATIYSDSERSMPVSNGILENGVTYYFTATETGYVDYDGSFTVSGSDPVVEFAMTAKTVYNYTVNAIDGDKNVLVSNIVSGTCYANEAASFYIPACVLKDGTLYFTTNEAYSKSETINSDNKVISYEYTASSIDNVVYFCEGENLAGATEGTPSSYGYLASKGHHGRGTNLTITTLPAGGYTIYVKYINTNNGAHSIVVTDGTTEIMNFNDVTARPTKSANFTLSEEKTLYVTAGGSSTSGIDYIYIVKSVSATITSAGWATLYTPYPLNFSDVSGLTAYTATYEDNKVKLNEVTTVPANTGVVLKGAANTYSIPVIASSSTDKGSLTGNATEATAYNGVSGKDLYMLALNETTNKVQFTKVISGSIAAGKAYLPLTASLARTLSVEFDGDATGITNATAEMKAEDAIFNLAGQRVAQPANGLYIVNGKKVLVK